VIAHIDKLLSDILDGHINLGQVFDRKRRGSTKSQTVRPVQEGRADGRAGNATGAVPRHPLRGGR
jgi:hypothetical protein